MISVKRNPKCQFFNSEQCSTGKKKSFRKEKNKGEIKAFTHKICSGNVCGMNSVRDLNLSLCCHCISKNSVQTSQGNGKEDLTEVYLLQGMKNFQRKAS